MSNDVRVQVPSLAPFPFSAEVNTTCGCGGMADALASGASVRKDVQVQVLFLAPIGVSFLTPISFAFKNRRKKKAPQICFLCEALSRGLL